MKRPDYVSIPYAVFIDPDLSHAAKMVYGRLKLYAGRNGQCFPTHETLATEVCLCNRQLRSVLGELREAGLIDWQRTRKGCAYKVYSDRQKTADLGTHPDRQKTADPKPVEIGRKLPISGPDRQKTADLDRQKTADRKAVFKKKHAACMELLRASLAKNGIPARNGTIAEKHLVEMVKAAELLGALEKLAEFIDFKAELKKRQGDPIGSTQLALMCVQQDFSDWLETQAVQEKPSVQWAPPSPLTDKEKQELYPELWAEFIAANQENKAS